MPEPQDGRDRPINEVEHCESELLGGRSFKMWHSLHIEADHRGSSKESPMHNQRRGTGS
ncbi:Hypothetical protein Cul210931_2294 [Corynebacterium ulcerans]|uniref:Uncharacterized protein n=1 Tax=Corynebacterium ulcerans FRC58 TaxID=1408268 RepID=A0ABM5U3X4_CORUL|nr:Hypothetical protein Cul210932_2341 [Corynebacterium ulcerans]AIU31601.1 Hypothetical protein Cul210931_2294 [Corynebacterium ulcerans]AIU92867.1 Hypothetical protein Cul05146_2333 [Corynebacterium ulcerans]AKN78213.1 Hypothetical protein CulFRC58_2359 [Corynebacterium ulcerans FRC58]ALD96042.1 Hypothetical protein Cul131001_2377 [Corynebacterium ulcerans]